ncbi:galactonate dehydratase (plasmid) [Halostagnicola larsenii XH-48]|uniref:Galactonate dehydratase n=1 Tax=Halostagnicola larsenii XH-48 TaxID=797299 RepID=W0JSQ1_9EURY|nr:galactonate dehydratase [Halostagnicola larsenii]AHG01634.1 galactonate dehydratase [Halostagnicola larsenii XH-48]
MYVTEYDLYAVPPRWQFLRLETSDGRVGWGEVYTKWHFAGDSEPATRNAVDQLMHQYVLGEDPSRIEYLWQAMYRSSFYRGGPIHMSAIAGIDEALWDLKGKAAGMPVYELLGGPARDRVRLYEHVRAHNGNDVTDPAAVAADQAREHVERGFTAVKLVPTGGLELIDTPAAIESARDIVGAVREAVGPDIDVALDFHGRTSKAMARRLTRALEEFDPMFVEEPATPEHGHALERIAEGTTAPIATGERLYTRGEFRPLLEADAVDVVQPDVSSAGGITETKKIADLAATYDASIAPHCPIGPIALAASLHVDAVAPNALIQEQVILEDETAMGYVENDELFEPNDGYLELPEKPGLGIEIDEDRVQELAGTNLAFDRSPGHRADGSVGER